MVRVYRFAGLRPRPGAAQAIAAVPYDVVTAEEARAIISRNPQSFLRVSRPDAEMPDRDPHEDTVYAKAKENFDAMQRDGFLVHDPGPGMYIYRAVQGSDVFLGLCCCLDTDDYRKNLIRRHEQTRYDKEEDRPRHIEAVKAHNGPVVLLFRDTGEVSAALETYARDHRPDTEVRTEEGAVHQVFRISDGPLLDRLTEHFAGVPSLYIADGHHRARAAVNLADRLIAAGKPAGGEVSRFMGVLLCP